MLPQNLQKHFQILKDNNIDIDSLFEIPRTGFKEKFIRKNIAPLVSKLPFPIKYQLSNLVKKMRNPSGKLSLRYPLDFNESNIVLKGIDGLKLTPWWGKKSVVCICHDVDNYEGYSFVDEMSSINDNFKIKSTFNFLTNDNYQIDPNLLRSLSERKYEIGLHGYSHDQGIAFRNPNDINVRFKKALDVLKECGPCGFRSPALSVSESLFIELGKLDIKYDSSLQIGSPFYKSVRLPYPYYLEKYGIWEMPLMIQDDNYFRDTNTPEEEIFHSLRRYVDEVCLLNGVFIINLHPHLMVHRRNFYENFLDFLDKSNDICIKTMSEVVEYAQGDTDNK